MAETKAEIIINDLELRKITESIRKILPHIINPNTEEFYRKNVNGVSNCLALIGDYRNIIITLGNLIVSMCPSMEPKPTVFCVDWKYGGKNIFCGIIKNEIVRDACRSQVLNNGD